MPARPCSTVFSTEPSVQPLLAPRSPTTLVSTLPTNCAASAFCRALFCSLSICAACCSVRVLTGLALAVLGSRLVSVATLALLCASVWALPVPVMVMVPALMTLCVLPLWLPLAGRLAFAAALAATLLAALAASVAPVLAPL